MPNIKFLADIIDERSIFHDKLTFRVVEKKKKL
jgi:hypothetical protein